jgi:cytochrome c553
MNKRFIIAGLSISLMLLSGAQASGNPEAGRAKAADHCAQCHGPQGLGNATFPRLAGQYSDYLVKVLKDYKTGKRENAMMNGVMNPVDPTAKKLLEQDIEDIAAYYGSLP